MSLYVIGDLHLSFSVDKPMDIFGERWEGHAEKLAACWPLEAEDTVVLAGDTSWAMNFEELKADFEFLSRLKGKKIILKGNHDYWWTSAAKMNAFAAAYGDIRFLNNNAFSVDGAGICGSRGWILEPGEEHDEKIIAREVGRLRMSLEACKKSFPDCEPIVFLHYPPIFGREKNEGILSLIEEFGVKKCFYGHLHGKTAHALAFCEKYADTDMKLVSADYLNFRPWQIAIASCL